MKHFTNNDTDFIYDYLVEQLYFDEDTLDLVTKAFGDNIDTYNKILYVKYAYDFDQIYENDIGRHLWVDKENCTLVN